jgi:hypothetical protein
VDHVKVDASVEPFRHNVNHVSMYSMTFLFVYDSDRADRPGSASNHEKQMEIAPKRKPIRRAFGYAATREFLNSWADPHNYS